jgi:hypothetical protein
MRIIQILLEQARNGNDEALQTLIIISTPM